MKIRIIHLKKEWIWIFVICTLIALGTNFHILSFAALILCSFSLVYLNKKSCQCLIFAIMSFANIFKMSPGSQSFFTYVLLLYVLLMIFKISTAGHCIIFIICFALYLIAIQLMMNSLNILRTIKFVANLFILYDILSSHWERNPAQLFKAYIFGVIGASVVRWSGLFPNVASYINEVTVGQIYYNDVVRFSGLYDDPNYYSVNVIIALCLLVILFDKKEIKITEMCILSGIMIGFIGLTSSKSALFMLILPVLMLAYSNSRNRRHFFQITYVIGIVLLIFVLLAGKIPIFNTVLVRINSADSFAKLTTGRSIIWQSYIQYFSHSIGKLLFGNGLGWALLNGKAAHNTYIDAIYYMGLLGSFTWIVVMKKTAQCDQQDTVPVQRKTNEFYSFIVHSGNVYVFEPAFLFRYDFSGKHCHDCYEYSI